jgi:hypothetical protein
MVGGFDNDVWSVGSAISVRIKGGWVEASGTHLGLLMAIFFTSSHARWTM